MIIFFKDPLENYLRVSFGDFYISDRVEQCMRLYELEERDRYNHDEQMKLLKITTLLFMGVTVLTMISYTHTHIYKMLVLFI